MRRMTLGTDHRHHRHDAGDDDTAAMHGGELAQVLARYFQLVERAPGARSERLAFIGERDVAGGPMHQRHPDLPLKLADVRADRRLRQAKPLGRPPETLGFRETNKGCNLAQRKIDHIS